jgi:hypothetical protein
MLVIGCRCTAEQSQVVAGTNCREMMLAAAPKYDVAIALLWIERAGH